MNTILSYIDSVFSDLPQSIEMQRLKDEMSVKMIDRYRRLLDEGKTENESVGIVLQELGDIDDWLESRVESFETEKTDYQTQLTLTNAEVDEYIQHRAKYSIAIASGVMMCILAPAFMMLTLDMYKWLPFLGRESVIGEALAVFLLFIFVAIAVVLFIVYGLKESQYNMTGETIQIKKEKRDDLKKEYQMFQNRFAKSIAIGVALCILGPAFMLLFFAFLGEEILWPVSLLLGLVSIGVFLFIFEGIQNDTYQKLLSLGEHDPEREKINKKLEDIAGIVFPVAGAVYVLSGFLFNTWGTLWIIFPILGVLFGVYSSIFTSIQSFKRNKR